MLVEDLADEGLASGIEKEDSSSNDTFQSDPFNPEEISIASKVVALDTVLRRIKTKTICLAPDFQRDFVWDPVRKSQLIESMMLKIPLPMFYVSEDENGVWEVVDGLQRLSTIRDFILGPDHDGKGDRLKGLEFWGDIFNEKRFFDLEKDQSSARIVNNIMESELSFTIISPDTPEKVKRNVFKRINTGGMRLSDQEIRHALYQGNATDLLKEMVSSESYRLATQGTIKDNRMGGRELVLRFLSFYIFGWRAYKGDMDDFLSNAMLRINGEPSEFEAVRVQSSSELLDVFDVAMKRACLLFGDHSFRKSMQGERRTPINKSLFDVWVFFLSIMNADAFGRILDRKEELIACYKELISEGDFNDSISRHGPKTYGVKGRYESISLLLTGFGCEVDH